MPALVLKGEDGKEYEFPNGTSKEKVAAYMTKVGVKPTERISGDYGGFSQPKTAFQKQASSRKLGIEVEQHAADEKQDISNAKAKFVGDVATAIPVAATLAATGGMAAPLIMGAAGGAASLYAESAKIALGADDTSGYSGLTGAGKKKDKAGGAAASPEELARRIGVDAALGFVTQGTLQLGGKLLSAAGEGVIRPMVARAAAKVDAGKSILGQYGGKLLNQLRSIDSAAGGLKVSIQPEVDSLNASMALRRTGSSDAFEQLWAGPKGNNGLASKITQWAEKDGTAAGLAEIKGEVSQAAFKRAGLNHEEQTALQAFGKSIDKKLGDTFAGAGAGDIYKGYKETAHQLHKFDIGVQLAEMTLGGYIGHKMGGTGGGVAGAVAAPLAMKAFAQKGAPWLLEKMLSDKTVAPIAKRAISSLENGNTGEAVSLFTRAMSQSGVKAMIGPYLKKKAEENAPQTMGSVVNPEKGPDRSSLIEKSDLPGSGSTAEANSRGRGDYQPTRADAQHMEQRLAIENKKETKLDREQFKKDQEGFKNERESMKMMDILKSGASKRTKRKALSMLLELEDKK